MAPILNQADLRSAELGNGPAGRVAKRNSLDNRDFVMTKKNGEPAGARTQDPRLKRSNCGILIRARSCNGFPTFSCDAAMFEHSVGSTLSPPFRSIPAEFCHKIHHSEMVRRMVPSSTGLSTLMGADAGPFRLSWRVEPPARDANDLLYTTRTPQGLPRYSDQTLITVFLCSHHLS